ncbi:hypothetical protein ABE82_26210 (plasmid) [Paenibacillus peoriae]|nr:hypothetical protein ABE82_26210 [Paenibacillus peoriae]
MCRQSRACWSTDDTQKDTHGAADKWAEDIEIGKLLEIQDNGFWTEIDGVESFVLFMEVEGIVSISIDHTSPDRSDPLIQFT